MPVLIPTTTLEKFTNFGDLLRYLRRRVGITQMELADTVGYSDAQISRLEQNLRPPDLAIIESHFVPALGLEDEPKTVARLLDLAADVRREDSPAIGLCPYKGLNYFDESDADLFVGRETLTNKLVDRTLALVADAWRFLAIVGASGSGKSSLVRAGLVPALRWNKKSMDWMIHVLTPTAHPLESLADSFNHASTKGADLALLADDLAGDARSLQRYARHGMDRVSGSRQLLVIDQFEELFALCHNEDEQAAFIGNLLAAASEPDGPIFVVITLRADFYAHCAVYEQLRAALSRNQEYIGAMSNGELRRAIEEPARRGRWEFEPGLVDLLLHDVGADAGHTPEPGALPLLSHALFETWQRRRGHTLTLSGYTSSGGVRGAIAETAEAVFADQFTHEQRSIARRIFLRLTELGDESGAGDTRRRATFNELILKPEEASATLEVVKALADARLITTSEDAAEVAHEALIREWPTLLGWLEEDRDGLRLHRHLTDAAQAWQAMGRDPGELYRGARLAQAAEWAQQPGNSDTLNALERAFLETSRELEEKEFAEKEMQHQRELAAERRRAEEQAHSAARLRRRALYLMGALLLALVMAGAAAAFANRNSALAVQNAESARFASTQQAVAEAEADGRATQQAIAEGEAMARATQQAMAEDEAHARATAEANALHERDLAQAQRLAAEANSLMLNNGDSNLIALLSIQSLNMQYTPAGDAVLASLTSLEAPPREFKGHVGNILGVDISPDGNYLATGGDRTARLWDIATGEPVQVLSGHTGGVFGVAFSPDGKALASASGDSTVRLWDVATGKPLMVYSAPVGLEYVVFSPDGRFIAAAGHDPDARIWDVTTGQLVHTLIGHENILTRLAYSPDGKYLLTGSLDKTARLWDVATGNQVQIFPGHDPAVGSVAFSPDGRTVATGDEPMVRLWDTATGQMVREFSGHQAWVTGIEFSPDSKTMATVSHDKTARLWDIASGQLIRVLGRHEWAIQDVAFSPDGGLVATAGDDRIAKVWSLQTFPGRIQFAGQGGFVKSASFSPDGKQVVTANEDGMARIWDAVTGQLLINLRRHSLAVWSAVFSPDGRLVLTASEDRTARLWDAASGEELRRFEEHSGEVGGAVFSPDGKYIVTTSFDGTARVWDAQTGKPIVTYPNQRPGHVNRVAFSPGGKTVVTSADDGTARIWDPLTGKDLMVIKGHTAGVTGVAFSPNGKYVLTGSRDSTLRLWDVATGREARRFAGHQGIVFGVAFSPDGKTVLSGGADATARLWDVQTGQEVRRFTGHTNEVRNVTYSSDGKYILTASDDGTARIWPTDLQDVIHAVCALLTRDLTSEERLQFGISDQEPTCPAQ